MPLILALVVIFLALLFYTFRSSATGDRETESDDHAAMPYVRKKYILSSSEFQFYKALRIATQDRYLIAPQVHLAGLAEVSNGERRRRTFFNKIIEKSVDFVLFDKDTVVAVLAIELDGSSHNLERRKKRDDFVNRLLSQIGLRLLRIPRQEGYDALNLRGQIEQLLSSTQQ